jgi:hypothetical protein
MNRIYSLAASAALLLGSLAPAHGAPKSGNRSPLDEAKMMFEDIDSTSATIADTAFRMSEMARSAEVARESHLARLASIKEGVNRLGREIHSLDAERDSLSGWEITALDQVEPLMHEVADSTTRAIESFGSEVPGPLAQAYIDETDKIAKYADEVTILLRDRLKLEKIRAKELRLQHGLAEASGS